MTGEDISNSTHVKDLLPSMEIINKGKENDRIRKISGSLGYGDWF